MNFKNNLSYRDNKRLYITGGIALGSLLIYVGLWMKKKFKKVTLNKWFDEYLNELKEMQKEVDLKSNNKDNLNTISNKNNLPINLLAFAMNLITELQSYLFNKENEHLELERIKNLNNEEEYERLVTETVEVHESYYETARNIIYSKTGVNLKNVNEMLSNIDQREFKEALNTQKKDYFKEDLPTISIEKLKEAYVFYAKTFAKHTRIANEQTTIMKKRPEYQEIAFKTIFQNKFLLKDMVKQKYNIDTKYLDQLVKEHDLVNSDSEIAYFYEMNKNTNTY